MEHHDEGVDWEAENVWHTALKITCLIGDFDLFELIIPYITSLGTRSAMQEMIAYARIGKNDQIIEYLIINMDALVSAWDW